MPNQPPPEDYDRIWANARFLRLALRSRNCEVGSKHDPEKIDLNRQAIKDFAAAALHECALNEWLVPPQLVVLMIELLDEPKRGLPPLPERSAREGKKKCVCNIEEPRTDVERAEYHDADFAELAGLFAKLGRQIISHTVAGNTAGAPKFEKAAHIEASYAPDPTGRKPSVAKIKNVADQSGASRDSIRRWREQPSYRRRITRLRSESEQTG